MVPGFHLRTNRFSPLLDRQARIEMDMVLTMQRNTGCPVGLLLKLKWCTNVFGCIIIFVGTFFCGEILLSFAC